MVEKMTCTIPEAAKMLGISDDAVRRWVDRPKGQRVPGFYASSTKGADGRRPVYHIWIDTLREYAERQSF